MGSGQQTFRDPEIAHPAGLAWEWALQPSHPCTPLHHLPHLYRRVEWMLGWLREDPGIALLRHLCL